MGKSRERGCQAEGPAGQALGPEKGIAFFFFKDFFL